MRSQCVKACLANLDCIGFTILDSDVKGKTRPTCILRRRRYDGLKTEKRGTEVLMNCLVKDRQKFCAMNANPLEKFFYEKNQKTVEKVWDTFKYD